MLGTLGRTKVGILDGAVVGILDSVGSAVGDDENVALGNNDVAGSRLGADVGNADRDMVGDIEGIGDGACEGE